MTNLNAPTGAEPTDEDFALIQMMASVHAGFATKKLRQAVEESLEVGIKSHTVAACQMTMALKTFIEVFGRDQTVRMMERAIPLVHDGIFD